MPKRLLPIYNTKPRLCVFQKFYKQWVREASLIRVILSLHFSRSCETAFSSVLWRSALPCCLVGCLLPNHAWVISNTYWYQIHTKAVSTVNILRQYWLVWFILTNSNHPPAGTEHYPFKTDIAGAQECMCDLQGTFKVIWCNTLVSFVWPPRSFDAIPWNLCYTWDSKAFRVGVVGSTLQKMGIWGRAIKIIQIIQCLMCQLDCTYRSKAQHNQVVFEKIEMFRFPLLRHQWPFHANSFS